MNWTRSPQVIPVLHRTTSRKEEVAVEATSSLIEDTYIKIHFPKFSPKSQYKNVVLCFKEHLKYMLFLSLRIFFFCSTDGHKVEHKETATRNHFMHNIICHESKVK